MNLVLGKEEYPSTKCNERFICSYNILFDDGKRQPQGIAPTIENGHVGAILYGCPQHFAKGAKGKNHAIINH